MSDFDELRRGSYHADAVRKATQQEAEDLSRESFSVDANARAEQQEAQDLAEERAEREREHRRVEQAANAPGRDYADHTVLRRGQQAQQAQDGKQGGGAVISKKSGLGAVLRHRKAKKVSSDAEWQRQQKRERRAERRQARRATRRPMNPLIVLLALVVGLYLVFCLPIDHAISLSHEERQGLSSELSWHVPGMPYYVLALGSDARAGETTSRTDTMILVRVDPLGGKLTMLSIPRDTMVQIEGYGTQKINAAYAFGGAAGAVREVHALTGAPISHVAVVHFGGIESLVDYLGGVTVEVPVDIYDPEYTGLVLPAGEHEMDGNTAMLFSRVRYGFALGDYQRQMDQRILMEAIMKKTLALPPTKIPGLVGQAGNIVGTTMRMYSILPLMVRFKMGMTIYQATVPSEPQDVDGVSYVVVDQEALGRMMDVINAGGDPAELT